MELAGLDAQLEALLDLARVDRERYLATLGGTDPERAKLLQRLLRTSIRAGTDTLRGRLGWAERGDPDRVPDIPGYEIVREVGHGGMARVFEAHREIHGVRRRVAIKVLRQRRDDRDLVARFEREQRILAALDHPNIAKLLDYGAEDGMLYAVLEFIEGQPIDVHFEPGEGSVVEVVEAMIQVADAVRAAHEKLVVHRDIKPENVLVDHAGVPRLIDFGIARVLGSSLGELEAQTVTGTTPLTLRYASPEQLRGEPAGTASDLYQLGLLMFRLLSGGWPYREGQSLVPMVRARDDGVAMRPSAVSELDPRRRRMLRGDLDAIVLKCLRPRPADRYPSVADFQEDLRGYLAYRPVKARQRTASYLARSFVRRHRLASLAMAFTILAVVAGVVGTIAFASRAQQYAERNERVLDAFTQVLGPANPYASSASEATVAEAVDAVNERFLQGAVSDPEFHVAMLLRLAALQAAFEDHEASLALLARAREIALDAGLGPERLGHIEAQRIEALYRAGELDAASAALDDARPRLQGPDRLAAELVRASIHADRGEHVQSRAIHEYLAERMAGADAVFQSRVWNGLAFELGRQGDVDAQIAAHRRGLQLLDPHLLAHVPQLLRTRGSIAAAMGRLGNTRAAIDEHAGMLALTLAQLGPAHPMTAKITANASVVLQQGERFEDAYLVFEHIDSGKVLAGDPIWRAQMLVIHAAAALYSGRDPLVLPSLVEALTIARGTLGPGSPRLAYYLDQLAWALFELGELELAAAAAAKVYLLEAKGRPTADLVLQLAADAGRSVLGRPDPAFEGRSEDECGVVHYRALRALRDDSVEASADTIPQDCPPHERARLAALGFSRAVPAPKGAQSMRSPLVSQRSADAGARFASPAVDPALREQLRSLVETL